MRLVYLVSLPALVSLVSASQVTLASDTLASGSHVVSLHLGIPHDDQITDVGFCYSLLPAS